MRLTTKAAVPAAALAVPGGLLALSRRGLFLAHPGMRTGSGAGLGAHPRRRPGRRVWRLPAVAPRAETRARAGPVRPAFPPEPGGSRQGDTVYCVFYQK
jgi:hypothetical protein